MDLRRLIQLLALLVATIAIAIVIVAPKDAASYTAASYSGIFAFAFVTGVFPGPTTVAIFVAGAHFHPLWIAVSGGLGSALGESTSYLASKHLEQ